MLESVTNCSEITLFNNVNENVDKNESENKNSNVNKSINNETLINESQNMNNDLLVNESQNESIKKTNVVYSSSPAPVQSQLVLLLCSGVETT